MQSLTPELYLKIAKDIDPEIFENKTPLLHIKMLEFLLKTANQHDYKSKHKLLANQEINITHPTYKALNFANLRPNLTKF